LRSIPSAAQRQYLFHACGNSIHAQRNASLSIGKQSVLRRQHIQIGVQALFIARAFQIVVPLRRSDGVILLADLSA